MIKKTIKKEEKIFYIFKINSTTYSLFDSKLDQPIEYGGKQIMDAFIKSIKTLDTDAENKPKKLYKIYFYFLNSRNVFEINKVESYNIR